MNNFEWNENKAEDNKKKHGISFEVAITVFDDPFALFYEDVLHSFGEDRYIVLGYSKNNKLIVVSFTFSDDKVGLISARLTTNNERKYY
jgi:uncharacterized protein